jgi:DnaK suppressor protein
MAKPTRSSSSTGPQKKSAVKTHGAATAKKPALTAGQSASRAKAATKPKSTPAKATRAPAKPASKKASKPAAKPAKTAVRKSATHAAKPPVKQAGKTVAHGAAKSPAKKPATAKKVVAKPSGGRTQVTSVAKAKPAKNHASTASLGKSKSKGTPKLAHAAPSHKASKPVASASKPASVRGAQVKAGAPARKSTPRAAHPATATTTKAASSLAHTPASPARHETVPFKGRVASATAMVTPRSDKSTAHGGSNKNQNHPTDSMNKTAAKLDNGVTREDGRYALPSTSVINLPHGYVPSSKEEYMNPRHLAYFREKLRNWRDQLVEESRQTMDNLRGEVRDVGDEAERATRETENSLELRTRDRYRKLIAKIDKALRRIEEGTYGFCEETDEEIGIERLDARPIATLSLDAQERREHLQKQMGD